MNFWWVTMNYGSSCQAGIVHRSLLRYIRASGILFFLLTAFLCRGDPTNSQITLYVKTGGVGYDWTNGVFYASAGANTNGFTNCLVSITPFTGSISVVTNFGAEPGDLIVSSENRALYVAIPSQNAIRRYDLASKTLGPAFDVGGTVKEMAVMPGQPERLAVIRKEDLSVSVYENGTAIPGRIGGDFVSFVSIICPGADGSRLYGYDLNTSADNFYRITVCSNGVSLVDESAGVFPLPGANMRFANGDLYAGSGWAGNPEQKTLLGQFAIDPNWAPQSLVAPDLDHHLIFLLGYGWPNSTLYACDPVTYQTVGTGVVSNTTWSGSIMADQAYVHDFQRWGDDGFACRTYDKVFINRSSLVPMEFTNDLGLTLTTTNNAVTNQQAFTYSILTTNLGPSTASNIVVTFSLPPETSFISATNNRGSVSVVSNTVTCITTNLPVGVTNFAWVTVRVQTTNVSALLASATVSNPGIDQNQGNNSRALLTIANWRTNLDQVDVIGSLVPTDGTFAGLTGRYYFIFDGSAGALANLMVSFNPVTGVFDPPTFLPGGPQKIVAAADVTNSLEVAMLVPGDVRLINLLSSVVTNETSPTLWQTIQAKTESTKVEGGFQFTQSTEMAVSNNEVLGQFPMLLFYHDVFEPDAEAGRFYQLAYATDPGTTQHLRVFDTGTFRLLQDVTLPIPLWNYDSFSRWGQGFLLRAAEGLVVWRSALLPYASATDLRAGIVFNPAQATMSVPVTLVASVTNAGPNTATNVVLHIILPPGATVSSVTSSAGTLTTNTTGFTLSIAQLNTPGNASITATLRSTNTGILVATADVSSQSIDTNSANDSAICSALITNGVGWPALDNALTIPLAVNDLVYEPVSDRLFVSLGSSAGVCGNSVVAIDPGTGLIRSLWLAGSEPGKLAVSGDGQSLYVSVSGSASIFRFRLADGVEDQSYSIVTPASDMAVQPGHPDTVALVHGGQGVAQLALYRSGQQLSNTVGAFDIQVIGFNDNGDTLFGYGNQDNDFLFSVMKVTSNGASLTTQYSGLLAGFDETFRQEGGLIFGTDGMVFDPIAEMPRGLLPNVSHFGGLAPHVAASRAYGMTANNTNAVISFYDLNTMTLLEQESFPAATDYPGLFQRCGGQRLAYVTQSSVVVLGSSLVPVGPVADLGVSLGAAPDHAVTNQPFQITLSVTNAGPSLATNCIIAVGLPSGLTLVAASCGGGWLDGGMWYACGPGNLKVGQSAQWTLTLTSTEPGLKFLQAYVAAAVTDPNSSNDVASCFIPTGCGIANGSLDQFPLPARSLYYNPARGKLYAALPAQIGWYGNSVVEIDPATSQVRGPLWVGSEPVALTETDDGHFLYVSMYGVGGMRRLNLDTWTVEPMFPVGAGVISAVALAGSTNAVMLSHGDDAAVFVNGSRTSHVQGPMAQFTRGNGSAIYGFDSTLPIMPIMDLAATGNSVSINGEWDNQFFTAGVDLRFAAGHLFSNRGDVLDPVSEQVEGRFAGFAQVDAFAPEGDGSKLYTYENGVLQVWGTTNYQMIATANLSRPSSSTWDLCRWGTDGLACLEEGYPIWFRSSVAGNALPAGPLALNMKRLSPSTLQLNFPSLAGYRYRLEYTTSLSPANWQPMATNLVGGDNIISITPPLLNPVGFLRVVQEASH
jgi:uncharacterized repeat protein (TIGR01451 family)